MATILRNAQGWTLGLGRISAVNTQVNQNGTLQTAALLQDVVVTHAAVGGSGAVSGLVTAIRASGQNVFTTNAGMPIQAFFPNAMVEGHRSLGIPLDSQQQVSVDWNSVDAAGVAANATVSIAVNTDPINRADVIPVNALGPGLDYCAGLGGGVVPPFAAGAPGLLTLTATVQRPITLGRLVVVVGQNPEDMMIRSLQVNTIELMSGLPGAAGEAPSQLCQFDQTDNDGNTIAYECNVNDQIQLQFANYNAAASWVGAGFFLLPKPIPLRNETLGQMG